MITTPVTSLQPEWLLTPSNGEIHYLWHYIQGSIMDPEVRRSLCDSWGFCERHAWVAIRVEAALRHCFMIGPAIVYEDLLERATEAFNIKGPLKRWQFIRNFKEKGPCLMCDMKLGPRTEGIARKELVRRASDLTEMVRLMEIGRPYWEKTICGRCLDNGSWIRCRPHLIEDLTAGKEDHLMRHKTLLNQLRHHMIQYSRSYTWDYRGTGTDEDRASLISAVGWFSGWRPFLEMVGMRKERPVISGPSNPHISG